MVMSRVMKLIVTPICNYCLSSLVVIVDGNPIDCPFCKPQKNAAPDKDYSVLSNKTY